MNSSRFSSPIKHSTRLVSKDVQVTSEKKKKALFVLLDNFSMVSFTGAVDVLVTSNLITTSPVFDVETASVDGEKVISDLGIEVAVNHRVDAVKVKEIDILVICGGLRTPLRDSTSIHKLITRAQEEEIWIGGLWNGTYFLAAAGMFDMAECATHPDSRDLIRERYPNTRIGNASYTIENKSFTCVGPNSAIRVMQDLIEKLFGADMKRGVNGILNVDENRSVNSAFSSGVNYIPKNLEIIIELMENNLEEPLDITDFSDYTSLSRRQIERLFSKYVNTSPSRYYLELRLNKGRQLLRKTDYSISEVAIACGFTTQTHFSHSFKMVFGSSPTQFRQAGRDNS